MINHCRSEQGVAKSSNRVILETIKRYYRVDRREIAFLRFIIEAYDGIAVLRTQDRELGLIVLDIAPGCEAAVDLILRDLKHDILIEPAKVSQDHFRFIR
ncbi:MAG: DUF4911 domain-containing protein [Desulfobacterales bacterium]|jgi:hypothetical protein